MILAFILGGLFSLALASFFSAGEAALSRYSHQQFAGLARERKGGREEFANLIDREKLLLTAIIGRLLFVALFFVICVWSAILLFEGTPHAFIAGAAFCGGAFLMVLLIGEATAKSFARATPERTLVQMLPALRAAAVLLAPARWLAQRCTALLGRLFAVPVAELPPAEALQEMRSITDGGEQSSLLPAEHKQMIESVLSLPDVDVAQVMTPRTTMVALPSDAPVRTAYELFLAKGFSRLPVYQETLDNVVGILFVKDLLAVCSAGKADVTPVSDLMRQPYLVPETMRVSELLQQMRRQKTHMAIVLDEYGGTAGLVTNEDVVEEIVGEIRDEFDPDAAPPVKRIGPHTIEVEALLHVGQVNRELRLQLPQSEDYETIGGLLLYHLGRIPAAEETFDLGNVHFTVLEATPRRIRRLRIEAHPDSLPVPG